MQPLLSTKPIFGLCLAFGRINHFMDLNSD